MALKSRLTLCATQLAKYVTRYCTNASTTKTATTIKNTQSKPSKSPAAMCTSTAWRINAGLIHTKLDSKTTSTPVQMNLLRYGPT